MAQEIVPGLENLRWVFLALHIAGGHVGVPILVLTFFISKRVHRPITVINFCITWILYSVSYTLLLYTGHHDSANPPFNLCLTQAAMIHGAPPMAAIAGMGVVVQAYTIFQLPWQNWVPLFVLRLPRWVVTLAIMIPPYLMFAAFAISTAVLGMRSPDAVTTNLLYCTLSQETGPFERYAVPGFCAGLATIIVALEVTSIVRYYRGWLKIKQVFPLVPRRPSLSPWCRVAVFTLYSIVVLGACISYLFQRVSPVVYIVQATLPLVATLVFGTQTDIIQTCCFWKRSVGVCNEPDYEPGGGWSRPSSTQISPAITGHLTLSSEA